MKFSRVVDPGVGTLENSAAYRKARGPGYRIVQEFTHVPGQTQIATDHRRAMHVNPVENSAISDENVIPAGHCRDGRGGTDLSQNQ